MNVTLSWWLLLQHTTAASIAALGFALLFNVPKRTLIGCALAGALAYAVRTLLLEFGLMGIEASTLLGATVVSFFGVMLGRSWHVPASVYIVPGVIPLVPGAMAFKTMISLLALTTGAQFVNKALLMETAVNSLKTVLIVGGIAAGVAMPSLLLRRRRPMT
jgi:uncharacterized membrane protein YjjB (DUF3815 family)